MKRAVSFCDRHKKLIELSGLITKVHVYLMDNQPILGRHWTLCQICSAPAVCKVEPIKL